MNLPTITPPADAPQPPVDYAAYLARQLAVQQFNVASYRLGDEQVWVKKANTPHGMARYRVLGALATLFGLPVLIPVPNLGGHTAIATEVQRLRDLAARGLRVPTVLAAQEDGFIMRHLGRPAEQTPSLVNKIDVAPYFNFDLDKCVERVKKLNPNIQVFPISALKGEGIEPWADWLRAQTKAWNA